MNTLYGQQSTGSGFGNKALVVGVRYESILLLIGLGGSLDVNASRQYPAQDSTASTARITQQSLS